MSVSAELIARKQHYAAGSTRGDLLLPPPRKDAVVVCMNARIDPSEALGLEESDAQVIRNAGGRAVGAISHLVISHRVLGTSDIAVIHHVDRGLLTFENDGIGYWLVEERRPDARWGADAIDFHPFHHLDLSVRDDIASMRTSPLNPQDIPVNGFVYDVHTGAIRETDQRRSWRLGATNPPASALGGFVVSKPALMPTARSVEVT